MRKKIVAGNWKMNMTLQDGVALAKELNETLTAEKPNCGVVICTPFIHLATIAQFLNQDVVGLGAENCADKEKGAYTGEVSAEMVKSTGAQYVILGHSERRQYYNETPEILKEKVLLALKNGLKVIFCIGESLEEREANKQNEVVKAELEGSVFNLSEEEFKNIIIAYEPIWAIGTGKTATAEQAEEIHAYIRSIIADRYGKQVADDTTILYGGSCKASNAPELFSKPDIDGGLIGGASLKAPDFKGIIDAWKLETKQKKSMGARVEKHPLPTLSFHSTTQEYETNRHLHIIYHCCHNWQPSTDLSGNASERHSRTRPRDRHTKQRD